MIIRAIIFLTVFFFSTLSLSYSNENIVNQALNLSDKNKNKEAIDLLLTIAEDPLAQYYLGSIYSEKLQDYENAITWYESCARFGDVDCQYYAYFINSEIFEDLEISQYWLELCADQGDSYCLNDMGYRYDNGIYVEQNYKKAFYWFSLAAEQGLSNAYTSIASYYLDGLSVNQNYSKAFDYYNLGTESEIGNPERAIYGLALMHEKGLGTKVDYNKAKELLLQANKLGHELSLVRKDALEGSIEYSLILAESYKTGKDISLGLPIDYEESAFFYKIAEFKGGGDPTGFQELIDIMDEGNLIRQWDRAAERFEIWKSNLGFTEDDSLYDITQFYLSHTGTASYINSNYLVTNKHITHTDDEYLNKCDKIIGYDPYNAVYEEYEIFETQYLPKSLDVDLIYNPNSKDFDQISISVDKPRLGEPIIAIGFPQGDYLSKYPKITAGLVSSDFGLENEPDEFIIDATSYGGSSGSPIYNNKNQLIGILWGGPTMQLSSNPDELIADPNLSFVVKSQYLNDLLNYNEVEIKTDQSTKKYEPYESAEMNINRIRFIECYKLTEKNSKL